MLTLDKIEVRLSFLPVIDGSGKNRQAVSLEARDIIRKNMFEYSPADNSYHPRLKLSQS
jgi:hypothetical protein